jgi:glycosyltransferase involved in cell wall biosynthesis
MIGILVTTYNRPEALARSLPQIAALGARVLLVDDGTVGIQPWAFDINCALVDYLKIPWNRGLACAMNIGLSYWLADKSIEWVSYFQDDCDVHPKTLEILAKFHGESKILTGHDAGEHPGFNSGKLNGIDYIKKMSIRATHIHAHRDFWESIMPIPTRGLGAPKRTGEGRGLGSNVDWWMVRDSPNSCQKTKQPIICAPGLVRSFLWQGKDSCWNNTQKSGEEPPLREYA